MPLGSLVSGLFGLTSQAVNYSNQMGLAQRQFEYDKELLQQQNEFNRQQALESYQRNVEQWNRENEYNAPAAQVQRLKDAGLNPHLVYGHGSIANTANGSPQLALPSQADRARYNPPQVHFDFQQAYNQAIQSQLSEEGILKEKAGTGQLKSQTSYYEALATKTLVEAADKTYDLDLKKFLRDKVIEKAGLENQYLGQQISNLEQEGKNLAEEYNIKRATANKIVLESDKLTREIIGLDLANQFAVESFNDRLSSLRQSIRHVGAQIAQIYQSIEESQARVEGLDLQNALTRAYGKDEAEAKIDKIVQETVTIMRKEGFTGETGNVMLLAKKIAYSLWDALN